MGQDSSADPGLLAPVVVSFPSDLVINPALSGHRGHSEWVSRDHVPCHPPGLGSLRIVEELVLRKLMLTAGVFCLL